jgi:integrase
LPSRKVAASTQNQALGALLFLYREVLGQDLPWLDDLVRARRPHRVPVVMTRDEVRAVLQHLAGVPRLMALLFYGAGLRLLEGARLRVHDVDFGANLIVVRDGKGAKDRVTMLPAAVKGELARHLEETRRQHARDLQRSDTRGVEGNRWTIDSSGRAACYPTRWRSVATRVARRNQPATLRETRATWRHHSPERVCYPASPAASPVLLSCGE